MVSSPPLRHCVEQLLGMPLATVLLLLVEHSSTCSLCWTVMRSRRVIVSLRSSSSSIMSSARVGALPRLLLTPSSTSLAGLVGSSSLSHGRTTSSKLVAANWRSGHAQLRSSTSPRRSVPSGGARRSWQQRRRRDDIVWRPRTGGRATPSCGRAGRRGARCRRGAPRRSWQWRRRRGRHRRRRGRGCGGGA